MPLAEACSLLPYQYWYATVALPSHATGPLSGSMIVTLTTDYRQENDQVTCIASNHFGFKLSIWTDLVEIVLISQASDQVAEPSSFFTQHRYWNTGQHFRCYPKSQHFAHLGSTACASRNFTGAKESTVQQFLPTIKDQWLPKMFSLFRNP